MRCSDAPARCGQTFSLLATGFIVISLLRGVHGWDETSTYVLRYIAEAAFGKKLVLQESLNISNFLIIRIELQHFWEMLEGGEGQTDGALERLGLGPYAQEKAVVLFHGAGTFCSDWSSIGTRRYNHQNIVKVFNSCRYVSPRMFED